MEREDEWLKVNQKVARRAGYKEGCGEKADSGVYLLIYARDMPGGFDEVGHAQEDRKPSVDTYVRLAMMIRCAPQRADNRVERRGEANTC